LCCKTGSGFVEVVTYPQPRHPLHKHPFKWRHFPTSFCCACGGTLSLSYLVRDDVGRGLTVDDTTVIDGCKPAPELDKRCRPHLRATNDSWRVEETYIEVKGEWKYLYRAVDSEGNTLDFLLSVRRDARAAERCLGKALKASHNQEARVINVDKNAAYPRQSTNRPNSDQNY